MKRITTQTGNRQGANSDCALTIKVCDVKGSCCQTVNLDDNVKNDREKGKTDTFTQPALLGTCASVNLKIIRNY